MSEGQRKRALMIADADGLWTRRYIEHLLLPAGYEVVLFPIWKNKGKNEAFYQQWGITVYQDLHTLPVVRHVPRARMWARVAMNARKLRALGPFDVIHNHYLSQRDLALAWRVRRTFSNARWVCSFWGSDLMRATRKEHVRMRPYLLHADAVTIHSQEQRAVVRNWYGSAVEEKTALVYFGQTIFDEVDCERALQRRFEIREAFGIREGRYVVCVGYNASSAQHQPQVLHALSKLPSTVQKTLAVVVQLSYGRSDETYMKQVQEAADSLECQTILLHHFLNPQESARLRLCADVFILAIQTDSFSASLQEYLYAGAQVLVADWLTYPQLKALGVEMISFHDYRQIPELLQTALATPISEEQKACRALLKTYYSWDAVREDWLKLYREI